MSCRQTVLSFVSNPFAALLFLWIFMSQARSLEIHVNTIMRDARLKHFSNNDLQHASPKSVTSVCLANNLCLPFIKRLPGPTHILANSRLMHLFFVAFPDLLNSPPRD